MPESVMHRPIATRRAHCGIALARRLRQAGVRPNQFSALGLVVATLAAALADISAGGIVTIVTRPRLIVADLDAV